MIKARHNLKNIVFLDIRKANLIFGLCLFCIFVKNTIYELLMEVFGPAVLARVHVISHTPPFPLIHPTNQYHIVASKYLKYYIIYHLTYNHLYIIEFNIDPPLKSDIYLESVSIVEHFIRLLNNYSFII